MAGAFTYLGFTIEPNVSAPSLKVDGVIIPVEQAGGTFSSTAAPGLSAPSLDELAKRIVERSHRRRRRDAEQSVHIAKLKEGVDAWNSWRDDNPHVRPLLSHETLNGPEFADLCSANLAHADLQGVDLRGARLDRANFHEANLAEARLDGAFLNGADFCRADLYRTNMSGAHMEGANLQGAQLAGTDLRNATLHDCTIYGLSAWDLKMEGASQRNLRIVYVDPADQSARQILVDDLTVAQFIYLMLHNSELRRAIDTITSKVVLILGRFTEGDRKRTLDAVREALRRPPAVYVPVIFDFPKPESQSYLETVVTLAHFSRLVIADMTDARLVLEEIPAIANSIGVPIQPIQLEGSGEEPLTLDNLRKNRRSVLKTFRYRDQTHLLQSLQTKVIEPAERRGAALRNRSASGRTAP